MEAVRKDYRTARLRPADRAMLDFADKLTLSPGRMQETDLTPLRQAGFDDSAILEIVQVTSFFNYINRVADALGVEDEPEWS